MKKLSKTEAELKKALVQYFQSFSQQANEHVLYLVTLSFSLVLNVWWNPFATSGCFYNIISIILAKRLRRFCLKCQYIVLRKHFKSCKNRGSHQRCSTKKAVPKDFAIFTEDTCVGVYFEEHLQTAASARRISFLRSYVFCYFHVKCVTKGHKN